MESREVGMDNSTRCVSQDKAFEFCCDCDGKLELKRTVTLFDLHF